MFENISLSSEGSKRVDSTTDQPHRRNPLDVSKRGERERGHGESEVTRSDGEILRYFEPTPPTAQ